MTTVAIAPIHLPDPEADERRRVTPSELAAPLCLMLWFIVTVEPFELLIPMPGPAESVLMPGVAAATLVLMPRQALRRIPVSFAILALVLWMASSFIWSGSDVFTFLLLRNEVPALVMVWLVVGSMRPHVAVTALLCFFAAVGAWSLLASMTLPMSRAAVQGLGPEGLQVGWRGTFGHKNILGIFSVLGMGLALAFERRPGWRPALIGVLLGASFGSRSATAASGMLATVATYSWLTVIGGVRGSRERAMLKLALIGSLVVAVLLIVGLLPMLVGIYGKDLTFSGRTEIWAATLEAIDDKPVTGYGIGGVWFDVRAEVTRNLHGAIGFGASHAHNGFLNLWLESGLIGVALFAVVLARTVRLGVACLRESATAAYGRWALPSLAGFVLMSLSEPLFRGFGLGVVVIIWTVLARLVNDRERGRPIIEVDGARPWWTLDPGYPAPAV